MQTIADMARIHPSPRQIAWHALEFYGFCHFGMNTFTNREWGMGAEDPSLFAPKHLDAEQWVDAFASAGMRGMILCGKHHDGFCLWPSAVTDHSVKRSPWQGGRGEAYNHFFRAQLTELLTGYGPIFSVCGPDVRWCGNEAGAVRASEWSVVPAELRLAETVAAKSQTVDDGAFSRRVTSADEDLGSRKICTFTPIVLRRLRVRIVASRWCPTLRFVGAFCAAGSRRRS